MIVTRISSTSDVHRDEEGHILHEPLANPPAPKGILKNRGEEASMYDSVPYA
jgi:hypothetical protein